MALLACSFRGVEKLQKFAYWKELGLKLIEGNRGVMLKKA